MAQAGDAPGSPLSARNPVPADPAAYPVPSGAHPARSTEKEAAAPVGEPTLGAEGEGWSAPAAGAPGATGIPAYRPAHQPGAFGQSARRSPDLMPGAVVKMPRRGAWLRMLAYEGSWQLCLEAMLGGQAEIAVQFLQDRCLALRKALELDGLLLGGAGSEPGAAGYGECPIYW